MQLRANHRNWAALAFVGCAACSAPIEMEASWSAFDRPVDARVWATTAGTAEELLDELRAALASAEERLGSRADQGLGRLNRAAADGYYRVEDQDLYRCLLLALDYARTSRGAYDPTVGSLTRLYTDEARGARLPRPGEVEVALAEVGWSRVTVAEEGRAVRFRAPGMRLDLDGIAPGFAVDTATRSFARTGTRAGLLRLGDVAYAWESPPRTDAWNVELADPRDPSQALLRISLSNRGVAVAGHRRPGTAGQAGTPLLDPRNGRPAASGLLAAVAVADTAADADALSAALFVLGGGDSGELLGRMRRVEALLLEDAPGGPRLLASASLAGRLELSPELAREVDGRVRYVLPPQNEPAVID